MKASRAALPKQPFQAGSSATGWHDSGDVFVLVEPSHAGNIGAAARALKVMGFNRLRLVNPREPEFRTHPEAIGFASGAQDVLENTQVFDSLPKALADCRLAIAVSAAGREFAAAPQPVRSLVAKQDSGDRPVAWVFGTERTGLSIEQAQQCQRLCFIDSHPLYGSLNLAQAVQVIAYERRQALLVELGEAIPEAGALYRGYATLEQVEGLMAHLEEALIAIGYLDPAQPKRLMPRLRRLFSRTRLEQEEVDILRGILRAATSNGKAT